MVEYTICLLYSIIYYTLYNTVWVYYSSISRYTCYTVYAIYTYITIYACYTRILSLTFINTTIRYVKHSHTLTTAIRCLLLSFIKKHHNSQISWTIILPRPLADKLFHKLMDGLFTPNKPDNVEGHPQQSRSPSQPIMLMRLSAREKRVCVRARTRRDDETPCTLTKGHGTLEAEGEIYGG